MQLNIYAPFARCLATLLLVPIWAWAQPAKVDFLPEDELLTAAITERTLQETAALIAQAKRHYLVERYDSAIHYGEKALEGMTDAQGHPEKESILLLMARSHREKGSLANALRFYLRAAKEQEKRFELGPLAATYEELGNLYLAWDYPKRTVDYFMKASHLHLTSSNHADYIRLLERITDTYERAEIIEAAADNDLKLFQYYQEQRACNAQLRVVRRMIGFYDYLKQYAQALKMAESGLALAKQLQKLDEQVYLLRKMGELYQQQGNHYESLKHFILYFILLKEENLQDQYVEEYAQTLYRVGALYQELGEVGLPNSYLHALNYYDKALKISESRKNPKEQARIYDQIGLIRMAEGNYREAVQTFEQAVALALSVKAPDVVNQIYFHLYLCNQKKGDFKEALSYYQLYAELSEQLLEDKLKHQKELVQRESAENRKQFIISKTEQMIADQEMDTLINRHLELEIERNEQELELLRSEKSLQDYALKNEQLKREKAMQALLLVRQQYLAEKNEKEIEILRRDREIQGLALKQKTLEEAQRRQTIELLERDKALQQLALSRNEAQFRFTVGILVLISIITLLLVYGFLALRKANRTLLAQKEQIEQQAASLQQANLDLQLAHRDISQKNELIGKKNEALIELNQEKNHLISVLAHDLRNPLSIAMSLTDFLRSEAEHLKKEQTEALNITERSLKRMNEMILRILDVRTIETADLKVQLEPVNLTKLVGQVTEHFEEHLTKKEIEVIWNLDREWIWAQADSQLMAQVVENLFSNALKFSPKGSAVTISIGEENGKAVLAIRDQGPGIAREEFHKLFGKYQRLSARPTGGEVSIGLGLSIVKKLVEAMKGEVHCHSEAGKGACFEVILPLALGQEAPVIGRVA